MKKIYRIKKYSEIDAIFKIKNVKSNAFFTIYQNQKTTSNHFRFAISIGKKYGNAVERNLIKRRLRMIITHVKDEIQKVDFVIVVKRDAKQLNYQNLNEELIKLLNKSKIME
jgi:ribonuclease P protein component